MPKDSYLIKQVVRKGSEAAAEKLIRQYYDELYYFLYRQIGNKEDSLDLTQEVFISALNSLSNYDAKKATFKTWLFRIGTYKVIDSRRKKKLEYEELEDNQLVSQNDVAEAFITKELLEDINQFVSHFKPDIQEVFRLKIYGGFSFKEIAKLLSVSEEKVKAQYYRLLDRVRKEFKYDEFKS